MNYESIKDKYSKEKTNDGMNFYNSNKNRNITYHKGMVSYNDRCNLLNQKGIVIWFTGLSGSGKSTIAAALEKRLIEKGKLSYRLDGDNIRCGINSDLGFSDKDRLENNRRVAEIAALFKDAGLIVLVAFISPFKEMRSFARSLVEDGNFMEVYVKADLDECIKRDPKGLYKKAMKGEINDFTGIDSPYEPPENPDLLLDTGTMTVDEAVERIMDSLYTMGIID